MANAQLPNIVYALEISLFKFVYQAIGALVSLDSEVCGQNDA